MTAGGGYFIRAEFNRNKRSALWAVAPIEVADEPLTTSFPTPSFVIPSGTKRSGVQSRDLPHSPFITIIGGTL